jgi:hypothetical protein
VLLPIALSLLRSSPNARVIVLVLAAANVANAYELAKDVVASDKVLARVESTRFLPGEPIVVWGDSFPFEYAYPVLAADADLRKLKIFGLGVFTFAPFAIAQAEEKSGNGLIARLRSPGGILIAGGDRHLKLLATYCSEHLGAQINLALAYQTELWSAYRVKCEMAANHP